MKNKEIYNRTDPNEHYHTTAEKLNKVLKNVPKQTVVFVVSDDNSKVYQCIHSIEIDNENDLIIRVRQDDMGLTY